MQASRNRNLPTSLVRSPLRLIPLVTESLPEVRMFQQIHPARGASTRHSHRRFPIFQSTATARRWLHQARHGTGRGKPWYYMMDLSFLAFHLCFPAYDGYQSADSSAPAPCRPGLDGRRNLPAYAPARNEIVDDSRRPDRAVSEYREGRERIGTDRPGKAGDLTGKGEVPDTAG